MDNNDSKYTAEDSLKEQFLDILENSQIKTVFQAIVSLRDGSVHGYEALSRGPQNTNMENPVMLFECAERYNKMWELELLCREKAIETLFHLNLKIKMFLNVNPNIMHDIKFRQGFTKEYLHKYAINPENIIFELTEREAIKNNHVFMKAIQNYKNQNYKIAIDDAGAGYSGLNLISDLHPHYIKLDMNLVRNVDQDMTKQSLIKSLLEFALLTNTLLIAEGIETESELLKLIEIGVHYGQGFYIQKPASSIYPVDGDIVEKIKNVNQRKNHLVNKTLSTFYVSNICNMLASVDQNVLTSNIYDLMEKDSLLPGLCITEDGLVLGVITRTELYKRLSGQYGYSLYLNKPIKDIMSKEFLSVDYHDSVEAVAKKAMQRDIDHIYDFITVTKTGSYFGIITVKDLLEKSILVEVNHAKHLNPLTELPGNILIEKQLERCLNLETRYTILYFDINYFKSYNDVYGFENGDRIIKHLAHLLQENVPKCDFIGHIGGDDFIAILPESNAEEVCRKIIDAFDGTVSSFYNQNDLDRGYINAKNRHGIEESYPLLSISIAGTSSASYKTTYDLSESMAKLKKECKQKQGSNYLIV